MSNEVELRLPTQGINEDSHPAGLDPNESVQMINVLPHNPSALSRRYSYEILGLDNTPNTNDVPLGVAVNGNNMLVSYARYTSGVSNRSWLDDYYTRVGEPRALASTTYPTLLCRYNGIANQAALDYTVNSLYPFGRAAYYEGVTYYPSMVTESTYAKKGSSPTQIEAPRLVAWAGANKDFATHTTNASATVGSTTLTITGTPGDLTGKFVTFDADRTTTTPYAYLIKEQLTTTTFRLDKAYGLGESAATSKVTVTARSRSYDIPIESPAGVYCVAAHLDRLFVGRAWVRDSVGDLPAAYYPNALKWSKALNPEKWPDANVTLVGSEPNDALMALVSLGRYLIIFKRNSTWVLAGDSEENFTVRRVSGNLGCIDSRSITEYGDSVVFAARQGIFMIDADLTLRELTSRKPGHGVRSTYQYSLSDSSVVSNPDWNYPMVSCAVDDNDYLHVMAFNDPADVLAGDAGTTYNRFPMSCHIPSRAWTRLQGTYSSGGKKQLTSPKMYSPDRYQNKPFAVGYRTTLDLSSLTNPAVPLRRVYDAATAQQTMTGDAYNNAGSTGRQPFIVDVVLSDQALNGYGTWNLLKLYAYHSVEYSGVNQAGATGVNVYGMFDPAVTQTQSILPNTLLGGFKVRWDGVSGQQGHTLYVTEISPRDTGDQDSIRGQFLRLRLRDTSTYMPNYWDVFKLVAVFDPGRAGRATTHLL